MSQPAFSPKEYDEKIKTTLPYYQEFYRQVVDTVKVLDYPSLSWLDLGCGTGKMGEAAFSAFAPKRFVFWDQSPEMIAIAKSRFADANAEFVTASLLDLHCREEFNVITAIEVNHYLSPEERRKAIANAYQALQPGGVFFTFENFAPNSRAGQQLALKRWGGLSSSPGQKRPTSKRAFGSVRQRLLSHLPFGPPATLAGLRISNGGAALAVLPSSRAVRHQISEKNPAAEFFYRRFSFAGALPLASPPSFEKGWT